MNSELEKIFLGAPACSGCSAPYTHYETSPFGVTGRCEVSLWCPRCCRWEIRLCSKFAPGKWLVCDRGIYDPRLSTTERRRLRHRKPGRLWRR